MYEYKKISNIHAIGITKGDNNKENQETASTLTWARNTKQQINETDKNSSKSITRHILVKIMTKILKANIGEPKRIIFMQKEKNLLRKKTWTLKNRTVNKNKLQKQVSFLEFGKNQVSQFKQK